MDWIQENGWSLITGLLAVWALYVSKWQQKKLERTSRRVDIANRLNQLLADYHVSKEVYYAIESGFEEIDTSVVEFKERMVNAITEMNKLGGDSTIMEHTLAVLEEGESMESQFERLKELADKIESHVDSILGWKLTDAFNDKYISEKYLTESESLVFDVIENQKRFKFTLKMTKKSVDTKLNMLSKAHYLLSKLDSELVSYEEFLGERDEPKIVIPNF